MLAFSDPVISIPIQVEQNQILIPAKVGSSGVLTFLLDTGAEATVIASDRVKEAGLVDGARSSGTTQGGEIETQMFKGAPVRAGNLPLGKLNIAAVDLSGLSAGTGRRIDGILGYEFFRDRVVRIDYAARTVSVLRKGTALGAGIRLPLIVRGNTPFIRAEMRQGRNRAEGDMLLDTGAVGAVTVYSQFLKAHPKLRPARSVAITSGAILPGQFVTAVGRLTGLRSGKLAVRSPVTNFSANADADDAAADEAGLIGGEVLSRYRLTLDYSGRRAVLRPSREANSPYLFDASGMSLTKDQNNDVKVRLVLAGSPAGEAGIKAGDVLRSIDGRAASELTLAQLRRMFRVAGATYRLSLRRGSADLELPIVTRRLI